MTDHVEKPIRPRSGLWQLVWPVGLILDAIFNRLLCLGRDNQGDDPDEPGTAKLIFLSYSSYDRALVFALFDLLRGLPKIRLFMDRNIMPGERWEPAIQAAIQEASVIFVFWCKHAQRSPEVAEEWRYAIRLERRIVPVIMDSTPVPRELGQYQWVDFREIGEKFHSNSDLDIARFLTDHDVIRTIRPIESIIKDIISN
jgi:TIR domain